MMMKSLKKSIKTLFVFVHTIYSALYIAYHVMKDAVNGKKNKKTKNILCEEVIIMGNGPSLNNINFKKINRRKYKMCCVNYYPVKSKMFYYLRPEYLCLIDPGFFKYTIEAEKQDFADLISALRMVDWPLTIIAPKWEKLPVKNPHIKYYWVNTYELSSNINKRFAYWLYNHNFANPGMQNVTLGALYFFIMNRCKKIYLAGVDLSDFKFLNVDENNRVYVDSNHSYGVTRYYYDEMKENGVSGFCEILGAYQKMFTDYRLAGKYAEYVGVRIANLSLQSYVDNFKKLSPEILYGKK